MTQLPQGWREAFLSDVCSSFQYGWTSRAEHGQGLGLLRTTDLTHPPVKWSEVPQCKELPKDIDKYLVRTGDFFISRAGSVGVSAFVEEVPRDCVFASYLIRLQASDRVVKRFLKWFLLSPEYWKQVGEASAGIALQNINATKLKSMLIPLPPLAEQERIVEILEEQFSRLDSALASVKAVREKAKAFRRSLLHAAFSGELTGGTEGWREVALGDISVVKGGKRLPKGTKWSPTPTAHPYIRATDVQATGIDIKSLVYVPDEVWSKISRYVVASGDVVITIAGTIGRTAVVPKLLDGANLTENAAKIVLDKSVMASRFLDYFLKSPLAQEVIEGLSTSTTQAKLALFRIETIDTPVPPLATQERIVSLLEEQFSRLDKALEVANQLEARIASERRSLLHSAFTGALTATWRETHV